LIFIILNFFLYKLIKYAFFFYKKIFTWTKLFINNNLLNTTCNILLYHILKFFLSYVLNIFYHIINYIYFCLGFVRYGLALYFVCCGWHPLGSPPFFSILVTFYIFFCCQWLPLYFFSVGAICSLVFAWFGRLVMKNSHVYSFSLVKLNHTQPTTQPHTTKTQPHITKS